MAIGRCEHLQLDKNHLKKSQSKKWIEMEEITTKFLTNCLKTARKVLLLKVWLQQFQLLCQLNTSVLAEWVKILLTSWGYKEQNSNFMHGIHAGNLF